MKVLVIGSKGQLGKELARTRPDSIEIHVCDLPEVDLCSTSSTSDCIDTTQPDWIINAAAYTAVDKAETEKGLAFEINHTGVSNLAKEARERKIRLVHISTDFVFDGHKSTPYLPNDTTQPESEYGRSKLAGEQALKEILQKDSLIIRTAWLYSSHGNNFVKTMLRLMQEQSSLNVIDEQIGTPTWANSLAKAVWASIDHNLKGTFHFTDAGVASWYDFAVAIMEEAVTIGLLEKKIPISPIPTSQYPTPAKRPMYSVLDKQSMWKAAGITPVHWRVQLRSMLMELAE